ncbi:MAG: VOC family protein [Acidimicrobiia bacterium]|jgi:methylmalonyl-CoA/ethylmalonyl-CoA epimerase
MSHSEPLPATIWERTYQIAVVVKNLDQAISFYEDLGIGPFEEGPSAHTTRREIYGVESPDVSVKGKIAQMGPIEFELLQPVKGSGIQAEFLEEHGEGVIHICAYTDDLDRDMNLMESKNCPVISYGELGDGGRFAYFDTRSVGGLILELFQTGETWE